MTITVRDYINGEAPEGATLYLPTAFGEYEVTGINWPHTDPWIVCGKANGGYGQSFCVHYDTRLIVRSGKA